MDNIVVSRINSSSPKYTQVWDLREEILRRPLGMSLKNEDLSRDHTDTIFIAEKNDKVIGCLMLTPLDTDRLQLRQMAVYSEWQGKNVGRLLVSAAERFLQNEGYKTMVLHARKVAAGFYRNLGYTVTSGEYMEVGIAHFTMEKNISR
jgi:predicted GNAT family N-acyltransferase